MIAVLAHTHPSITSGGAEISAYTLYRGLREAGLACCFIAACPEHQIGRVRLDTPDEHILPIRPETYDHFFHIAEPALRQRLDAMLDELGATTLVFHHFLNFGLNTVRDLAARPGRRSLLVLHEFLAICQHHGQMVTRPALRLCEAASPGACVACFDGSTPDAFRLRQRHFLDAFEAIDRFVSPSEFLRARFDAWGLPASRIAMIENAVARLPEPEPEPEAVIAAGHNSAAQDEIVIGYFGQINPFKGIDLLLDAVDLLKKDDGLTQRLRIRIHGPLVGVSDEFRARFEKLIEKHAWLEYLGPYQNDRVFELMRECSFVLMTSKWWENSPVVIQEAHACGRPLIVPGIGGMKEKVVDGVNGLNFRVGDARDLLRAFRQACDPAVSARLRQHLPGAVTPFTMARRYLDWMDAETPAPTLAAPATASAPPAGRPFPIPVTSSSTPLIPTETSP